MISTPQTGEYMPYFQQYIDSVPKGANVIELLSENYFETEEFLYDLPNSKLSYRYAEGKWSIKEILQHITDCERIFTYRALRIARFDQTPLAGFEENDFAAKSFADGRKLESLMEEFKAVRDATISLFENLDKSVFENQGVCNNNPISVRAIAFIIAGHEMHHSKVIQERYI